MESLAETRLRLDAKRRQIYAAMEEAGPEIDLGRITSIDGDVDRKRALLRQWDAECEALEKDEDQLAHLQKIRDQNERQLRAAEQPDRFVPFPTNGAGAGNGAVGLGSLRVDRDGHTLRHLISNHPGFKALKEGNSGSFALELSAVDFKTLVTLTTVSPQNFRQPDIVPMGLEERTVADLMLQGTIDRGIVEYYEETTFTNAATGVAEGSAKPESTIGFTLRTETAKKIAHNIPVTKEALDDNSFLESQIRGRLAFGVKRREEQQILTGVGTGNDLMGLLNRVGIQTQAAAGSGVDAIFRAMQLIRGQAGSGFAEPTAVVIHPANWTTLKLAKDTTGQYLFGGPSDEGPDRIWGLPVRQTTGITQNTALVGAFRPYAEVLRREGISIVMSTEHSTFFVENKVMLQAESRIALAVYRPSAFATVTGLT
jgi:HK97 family phage major capsid protein